MNCGSCGFKAVLTARRARSLTVGSRDSIAYGDETLVPIGSGGGQSSNTRPTASFPARQDPALATWRRKKGTLFLDAAISSCGARVMWNSDHDTPHSVSAGHQVTSKKTPRLRHAFVAKPNCAQLVLIWAHRKDRY